MGDLVRSQEEDFPVIRMANHGARYLLYVFPIPLLCRVVTAEIWLF